MSEANNLFVGLVISISASAWQGLGKIKNYLTGKVERNLEQAKGAIDLMEMLKEKTKNNLNSEEEKILLTTITDLQLNYVEELKGDGKPEAGKVQGGGEATPGDGETGAGGVNSGGSAAGESNPGGGSAASESNPGSGQPQSDKPSS